MVKKVNIEALFAPDCGSRNDTMALIDKTIAEMSVEADVRERIIGTADEAAEHHFLGSPSIRVNGADIDPEAQSRKDYGLG